MQFDSIASGLSEGQTLSIGSRSVKVLKLIGEGGFSFVFVVQDLNAHGQQYVLKRMVSERRETSELITRELDLMQRTLRHPNIVRMIDYETKQVKKRSETYLLLEYMKGGHLLGRLQILAAANQKFGQRDLLMIFRDVVSAVEYMHGLDPPLAHRDLKLENILLGGSGGTMNLYEQLQPVALCDFGSVKAGVVDVSDRAGRAAEAEVIEKTTTLSYRAPEMVDLYMSDTVSQAVDIWALGCVLYTMAFLRHPFQDAGNLGILSAKYSLPRETGYSAGLTELLERCLQPKPELRADVAEVRQCVESLLEEPGRELPPPSPRRAAALLAESQREQRAQREWEQKQEAARPGAGKSSPPGGGGRPLKGVAAMRMRARQDGAPQDDTASVVGVGGGGTGTPSGAGQAFTTTSTGSLWDAPASAAPAAAASFGGGDVWGGSSGGAGAVSATAAFGPDPFASDPFASGGAVGGSTAGGGGMDVFGSVPFGGFGAGVAVAATVDPFQAAAAGNPFDAVQPSQQQGAVAFNATQEQRRSTGVSGGNLLSMNMFEAQGGGVAQQRQGSIIMDPFSQAPQQQQQRQGSMTMDPFGMSQAPQQQQQQRQGSITMDPFGMSQAPQQQQQRQGSMTMDPFGTSQAPQQQRQGSLTMDPFGTSQPVQQQQRQGSMTMDPFGTSQQAPQQQQQRQGSITMDPFGMSQPVQQQQQRQDSITSDPFGMSQQQRQGSISMAAAGADPFGLGNSGGGGGGGGSRRNSGVFHSHSGVGGGQRRDSTQQMQAAMMGLGLQQPSMMQGGSSGGMQSIMTIQQQRQQQQQQQGGGPSSMMMQQSGAGMMMGAPTSYNQQSSQFMSVPGGRRNSGSAGGGFF